MKRIFYLYRDFTQMLGKHRLYIKDLFLNSSFGNARCEQGRR